MIIWKGLVKISRRNCEIENAEANKKYVGGSHAQWSACARCAVRLVVMEILYIHQAVERWISVRWPAPGQNEFQWNRSLVQTWVNDVYTCWCAQLATPRNSFHSIFTFRSVHRPEGTCSISQSETSCMLFYRAVSNVSAECYTTECSNRVSGFRFLRTAKSRKRGSSGPCIRLINLSCRII